MEIIRHIPLNALSNLDKPALIFPQIEEKELSVFKTTSLLLKTAPPYLLIAAMSSCALEIRSAPMEALIGS